MSIRIRYLLEPRAVKLYDRVIDMYPPWGVNPSVFRLELPFRHLITAAEVEMPTLNREQWERFCQLSEAEIALLANKPETLTKAWDMLENPAWQTVWRHAQEAEWRRSWKTEKLFLAYFLLVWVIIFDVGGHFIIASILGVISCGVFGSVFAVTQAVKMEETEKSSEAAKMSELSEFLGNVILGDTLFRDAKEKYRNGGNNQDCKKSRNPDREPEEPRLIDEAAAIIDGIRDQLGQYRTDPIFLTEYPALFDVKIPQTAQFFAALTDWEDGHQTEELAKRVKELFDAAVVEAKAQGIDYLNTDRRILARRAQLLTAKAASTPSASEKEALMAKVAKILADLNIAFLAHNDITAITTTNHPVVNPGPGGRPDAAPSSVRSPR